MRGIPFIGNNVINDFCGCASFFCEFERLIGLGDNAILRRIGIGRYTLRKYRCGKSDVAPFTGVV